MSHKDWEKQSDLKPCPFCGGDAKLRHDYSSESGGWYVIDCLNHGCMRSERSAWEGQQVSTGWRKTESEAIEAWNTRAERTCRNLSDDDNWFCCSKCGAETRGFMVDDFAMAVEIGKAASRCPNCGAKVVDR